MKNISIKENEKISDPAIKLIARISEGSVRDAISLLDRVLISQSIKEDKPIEEFEVRDMLAIADRTKYNIFISRGFDRQRKKCS